MFLLEDANNEFGCILALMNDAGHVVGDLALTTVVKAAKHVDERLDSDIASAARLGHKAGERRPCRLGVFLGGVFSRSLTVMSF